MSRPWFQVDDDTPEPIKWLTTSPRGEAMPIDCAYRYSFGKAIYDEGDLPAGWTIIFCESDEDRVSHFPVANGPKMRTPSGRAMVFAYLTNPAGEAVATWDEGRWWTPEESRAWLLMLAVPDTYVVAEGMREAQMPRWWRRRKRPRGQR